MLRHTTENYSIANRRGGVWEVQCGENESEDQ